MAFNEIEMSYELGLVGFPPSNINIPNPIAKYREIRDSFTREWGSYQNNWRQRALNVGMDFDVSELDSLGGKIWSALQRVGSSLESVGLGFPIVPIVIGGVALGGIVTFMILDYKRWKAKVELLKTDVLSREERAKVIGSITEKSGGLLGSLGIKEPLTMGLMFGVLMLVLR